VKPEFLHIPIDEIGQCYSRLRIIDPGAEAAMERSMMQFGQMTPVIVGRFDTDRYELVDGFKRIRAAVKLKYELIWARVFPGGIRAAKAAMIQLNMKSRTISELEKALVIRSLHRQDGLTQLEIAEILGRHASWVCRKLSLVERLCEEVTENLKLGLINMTMGRELAKLPRGNQVEAMKTVMEYNFTSKETSRLVALLLKQPRGNHVRILDFPESILEDRQPDRPVKSKRLMLFDRLDQARRWMEEARHLKFGQWDPAHRNLLISVIDRIEDIFADIRKRLQGG
jgi:ParB/RepB/Spo0J family partition protein